MAHEILADFETRSRVALDETNTYKYAAHPSTEVLCCAYSTNDWPVEVWQPGEPFPFADVWPDVLVKAFNAEFELLIWNSVCVPKYGWPKLEPHQVECLQARSSYTGLPRKLASIGPTLALGKYCKDKEGNEAMMQLTKPKKARLIGCEYFGGEFDNDPVKHRRNLEYAGNDVVTEKFVDRLTCPLPKAERRLWMVHQTINERGVPVDTRMCAVADAIAEMEKKRLSTEIQELCGPSPKGKGPWVKTPDCLPSLKAWMKTRGTTLHAMDEEAIAWALKGGAGELAADVRRTLEIRMLYRNKGISKYPSILNHADADEYCRGGLIFYKAGPGRWAGAGVNFCNMTRLREDDVPYYLDLADRLHNATELQSIYDELRAGPKGVIPTLSGMNRLAICAHEGKKIVVCDYSSVEMRGLHFLAGDAAMLTKIRDYDNGAGVEPYILAAADIYNKDAADIVKAERQTGKVQILGCGYLSGATTFSAFCEGYGIDMPLDRAQELVTHYRKSNPLVVQFWYSLQRAVIQCVKYRKNTACGLLEFYMRGGTLNCRLPSGRELKYYDAGTTKGPFGDELVAIDQRTGGRRPVGLPVLVENMVQAMCRDLLGFALVECHKENLPVVLHVYDEIVLEVDENDTQSAKVLNQIMRNKPAWARGMPVDAKADEAKRYTK